MTKVTFLNEPKDSINREAHIRDIGKGRYLIANLNMPYQGTISEVWTKEELQHKLNAKEIQIS